MGFVINTMVSEPHQQSITGMVYHPTADHVATVALDMRIKLWTMSLDGDTEWVCFKIAVLSAVPSAVCFSQDKFGSLALVSNGSFVSLWSTATLTRTRHNLVQHVCPDDLRSVDTLHNAHSAVAYSQDYLFVWNILSCTLHWSVKLTVDCLMPLPLSSHAQLASFVVVSRARVLRLFEDGPSAVEYLAGAPPGHKGTGRDVALVQIQGATHLAVLYSDGRIHLVGVEKEAPAAAPAPAKVLPETPRTQKPMPSATQLTGSIIGQPYNHLFAPDTHTVPPTIHMFGKYMDNLLQRTRNVDTQT
eukprot:NODE_1900_length_1039_cov_96.930303_g1544_i0.p1 GENE.NODE_1900_length_1039_cov_96.930303_g1544_i0~~NODE_1900_length_1039_cov_96.930303_g1544_i0.p1  ORF type:complete len:309 (-),score=78.05 NODE_1900_length_1039_cov_96.930303_g1544_i0:112-1017(-)